MLARRILFVVAIAAGLFFRLHDLGKPVPFEDEVMTWLRVSGHTEAELNGRLYDERMHTAGELSVFQRHASERGVAATVQALAVDDPHHAPLYFVLERLWSDVAGDSLSARRMLSATAGICFVAAFAWLCFVLFENARAMLIGASLAALSPFHIVYSQQAREYELWAFFLCLWSVAAVSAVRRNTPPYWIAYALAAIASLYVSLLSLPVLAAHALWAATCKNGKTRLLPFAAAASCALLAYAPWLFNLAVHKQSALDANTWTATPWPIFSFVSKWAFNLSATFFDLSYVDMRYAAISALVLVGICFACIELRRTTSSENVSFIVLFGGVSAAVFLVPDLLLHEHRSVTARYVLPVFIAVQLAVAGALAERNCLIRVRRTRTALLALALMLGTWSAYVRSTRSSWWENNKDAALPAIAGVLDARLTSPLLAEDGTSVLALLNLLDPRVRIRMIDLRSNAWASSAQRGTFVLTPSPALRARLESLGLRLEPVVRTAVSASLQTFRGTFSRDANVDTDLSLQILR